MLKKKVNKDYQVISANNEELNENCVKQNEEIRSEIVENVEPEVNNEKFRPRVSMDLQFNDSIDEGSTIDIFSTPPESREFELPNVEEITPVSDQLVTPKSRKKRKKRKDTPIPKR